MVTDPQLRKLGLFDARVPRYTSYPTAPHFSESIREADVAGWLADIPSGSEISVYAHVPFCRRLCWFCACRTQGTPNAAPVAAYLESLHLEIQNISSKLHADVSIGHLHWGGGTPTILTADQIRSLAQNITSRVPLAPNAQFSVEIDPNEVDEARIDALAEAGMNRTSIGVQDFDPQIQTIIGRQQTYATTKRAMQALRSRGINSLNMDILYGLPTQTPEKISNSVNKVIALSPDRIALYGYAHVPWMAKRQSLIPTDTLPTPEERLELFETARDLFLENGYVAIGIDHFAKPDDGLSRAQKQGQLRRNFQGYTDDAANTLIGLGASSISRYPAGYAQNNPATAAYQAAVRAGVLPIRRGHRFSGQDGLRGRMIEALMCDFAISIRDLADELDISADYLRVILRPIKAKFGKFVALGTDEFSIRPDGAPLARIIAREIDEYDVSSTGHSMAV